MSQAPSRTSGLVAPIMLLTGHSGEVFGVKFSPDGTVLASCSHDKHLFLWNVYGECENYMVLKGAADIQHVKVTAWCFIPLNLEALPTPYLLVFPTGLCQTLTLYYFITGHKNAVLDVHWTNDGEKLLSASPDKTVRVWDTATGMQTKKMTEHDNFVNSCSPLRRGPPLLVSGSDDSHVKVNTSHQAGLTGCTLCLLS